MDAKTAGHRPEELTKLCVKHFSSTVGIFRNIVVSQKVGDWSTQIHLLQNVWALSSWTVLVFLPSEITVIIAYYFCIIKDCNSAVWFQTYLPLVIIMCTSEGIHVRVDQGDHTQQYVHPSVLHMCCLELGSWSLYSSGETVWNCRWLTTERCNLEGTIKPWNFQHAPATYNFILHFVLHDIFGRVKVWEGNIVDQKQSFYYLLGKTYIV